MMTYTQQRRELFDACYGKPRSQWAEILKDASPELRADVEEQLEFAPEPEPDLEPEPEERLRTGEIWGRFEVGALVQWGGMGAIYRAREVSSNAEAPFDLAIKFIQPESEDAAYYQRMFDRECSALAQLVHDGIAGFVDGGIEHGEPYLVMELVDGCSILKYCREHPMTVPKLVEFFLPVCDAVHFAHLHGIQHRDLHPGNILVTAAGEIKIIDFGLARFAAPGSAKTTRFRGFCFPYSSPEHMDLEETDGRTDVYALAAVLYELLTGRPILADPAKTAGAAPNPILVQEQQRQMTRTTPPLLASTVAPTAQTASALKQDLDNILAMALAKEKEGRYGSVQEFRDDLERFCKGEPVTAVPGTLYYRGRKYLRKHWLACAWLTAASLFGGWRASVAAFDVGTTHIKMGPSREWSAATGRLLVNRPLALLADDGQFDKATLRKHVAAQRQFVTQIDALPDVQKAEVIGDLAQAWLGLAWMDQKLGEKMRCVDSTERAVMRGADARRLDPRYQKLWLSVQSAAAELRQLCGKGAE